ncbi:MAG TPA: C39 family peptidase [Bdellovibrionota bacterium]|nr:C39 family peptidase [Bdellovibrionota bacterium]
MNVRALCCAASVLLVPSLVRVSAAQASATFLPVPLVRQSTDYSCGAAAVASVLYYFQRFDGAETDLFADLDTNSQEGTHPRKMAEFLAQSGLDAQFKDGMELADVRAALESGAPVILDIQAWTNDPSPSPKWEDLWEDGHYVVAVGMDDENLYAMDPSTPAAYGYIPLEELPRRWHDYETRYGSLEIFSHLGIVVHGVNALQRFPAPPARIR